MMRQKMWKNPGTIIKQTSENIIRKIRGSAKEQWILDGTWKVIDERKLQKERVLRSNEEEARNKYKILDKEVKKRCRKDDESWMEKKAKEEENAASRNNTTTVYQIEKKLSGRYKSKNNMPVKGKQGERLKTDEEQAKRQVEHFNEVLNQQDPEKELHINNDNI